MRKPRPFRVGGIQIVRFSTGLRLVYLAERIHLTKDTAERLAAWLLKAAAWIREQETER